MQRKPGFNIILFQCYFGLILLLLNFVSFVDLLYVVLCHLNLISRFGFSVRLLLRFRLYNI